MDRRQRINPERRQRGTRLMPKVYGALFDINTLRANVHGLGGKRELTEREQERLLSRLHALETVALHLIDQLESKHGIPGH